jgi:hypothetical protein
VQKRTCSAQDDTPFIFLALREVVIALEIIRG